MSETNPSFPGSFLQQGPEQGPKSSGKFCLFISGATWNNQNTQGIRAALEHKFDPEGDEKNVMVTDSLMFSEGMMKPKRFDIMANRLIEEFQADHELVVMAYSYGAPELSEVMKRIEKAHPEWLRPGSDFLKKINVVMVAPFGFIENIGKAPSLMIKRYADVLRAQASGRLIPANELVGIESTNFVPVAGMDQAAVLEALTQAYFQRSQYKEGETNVLLAEITDYSKLPEFFIKGENQLPRIDRELCAAAEVAAQNGDWRLFKAKLFERGLYLRDQMKQGYKGVFFPEYKSNEENPMDKVGKGLGIAMLGLARMGKTYIKSLVGAPYKDMQKLRNKGARVTFLVPEFDVILTRAEARKFLDLKDEEETPNIVGMRGFTHANFPHQAQVLIEGLNALGL
jgi:hypothetical protein